jgi:hypothetical protein
MQSYRPGMALGEMSVNRAIGDRPVFGPCLRTLTSLTPR